VYKVGKIEKGGKWKNGGEQGGQEAFKLGCISHAILTMLDKNEL